MIQGKWYGKTKCWSIDEDLRHNGTTAVLRLKVWAPAGVIEELEVNLTNQGSEIVVRGWGKGGFTRTLEVIPASFGEVRIAQQLQRPQSGMGLHRLADDRLGQSYFSDVVRALLRARQKLQAERKRWLSSIEAA